ncbi:ABC transporter permease [Rhodohalobacter sp. 614A]|uniref:ABC transporter permease n=1 Tax=Rhodohalobacter sp. 614A TaxID=2908649 RepID=UPI001F3C78E0|nr:ABC transporter permease [Rhodohalobacter sp. 614A]
MIKYNFYRAVKNIFRFRSHYIIGISGLVLGMASALVITAWVIQEMSYDRFHDRSESIYMVTTDIKNNQGDDNRFPETPPPLSDALEEEIPSITNSTHFVYLYGGRELQSGDVRFNETGIAATSSFFDVFNFDLETGNPKSLEEPNSIFLTRNLATKIFSHQNPIGETVVYNGDKNLTVRGILSNIPKTSSLRFEYLISYTLENENQEEWWQLSDATFIKTRENADQNEVKNLSQQVFRKHITDEQYNLNLIPITDLRYKADFSFFNAEHGSYKKLLTLAFVAVLILVLACLNYTNLISAYAYKRRMEVMVRKVNGASSKQLFYFFLMESIVVSVLVWGLAVLVSEFFSFGFQSILDVELTRFYFNRSILITFPISVILIGIISGLFPAMLASSMEAITKTGRMHVNSFFSGRVRNAFILSQFVVSIALTISCLVIWQQVHFMESYDVGYKKENIIEVVLPDNPQINLEIIRSELLAEPNITQVSLAGTSPVNLPPIFTTEGWQWEGLEEGAHTSVYRIYADENYAGLFEINLVEGQFYSPEKTNENKIVINETFAGLMGFADPVGRIVEHNDKKYEIAGVMEDFNYQHLSNSIQPMAVLYDKSRNKIFIKTENISEDALENISDILTSFTGTTISYSLVSDEFSKLYYGENKIIEALLAFTLLTILLSGMGMIGMITFTIERRTKEIAIRKISGAKIREIMMLLNKGIVKWFLLGFIICIPFTVAGLNYWLDNFAFKVSLSAWIFIEGAAIILLINLLTVSWQTWRAAIQNPANSLRQE